MPSHLIDTEARYFLTKSHLQAAICAQHLGRLKDERAVTRAVLDRAACLFFDSALLLTDDSPSAMIGHHRRYGGE
jgi:hypothetical protein